MWKEIGGSREEKKLWDVPRNSDEFRLAYLLNKSSYMIICGRSLFIVQVGVATRDSTSETVQSSEGCHDKMIVELRKSPFRVSGERWPPE